MIRVLPFEPGVYRFRDCNELVLYIGRAAQLRSRVRSYWSNLRDRRHLAPMVAAVARIEAVGCASRHEAAWLERNLLEVALPPWNRTPGGQEAPAVIALDARRHTPGLRVLHLTAGPPDGMRVFGPYLGGLQVRRAVSGLHRLYPLSYTGVRLSSAEQAKANQLGVTDHDRDDLIEALTAVLKRDPAAVRRARVGLQEIRQQAAAKEAFELASRVHAECQGLDWISSQQRVTALNADHADICGFSDGLLTCFALRGGKLAEWTSCRSDPAAATARVALTPTRWREFARHNAALASALDRHRDATGRT